MHVNAPRPIGLLLLDKPSEHGSVPGQERVSIHWLLVLLVSVLGCRTSTSVVATHPAPSAAPEHSEQSSPQNLEVRPAGFAQSSAAKSRPSSLVIRASDDLQNAPQPMGPSKPPTPGKL